VQLSGAAARLAERYRLGVMSLVRLERPARAARKRSGPGDDPADRFDDDEDPFDGGPGGGRRTSPARQLADLAALNKAVAAMLDKVQPNGAPPNGGGPAPQPAANPNRGRLRHGNPSGDFLAAPRCGAQTRCGNPCRQPAMANGRCRLHGGRSTGARTAEGLARCRTASLVYGHRTAEIIQLKSAAARHGRSLRTLTQAARRAPNPQSERPTPCPASAGRVTEDRGRSVPLDPNGIDLPRPLSAGESTSGHRRDAYIPRMSSDDPRAAPRRGMTRSG
jgi:hypothetical protein